MVDWTMSVNPHWFSTIWGMLYIGGQGLSAFAFGICVLVMLSQTAPLNRVLTTHHFHDLGKFLFAFLMLWAYLSFSQFLIIWSANIPEEIPHYLDRWDNSWQYLSIFIIVGHFIVPYALLLSRDLKRTPASCASSRPGSCSRASPTTTGTSRPSCTRTGCRSACSTWRCRSRSAASSCRCSCRNSRGRSLLPVNDPGFRQGAASPCPLTSTLNEHDLEYGPTPPGAKHEHTDIDVSVGYKFALVAGGGDGALGGHRLRHVLVLRGPGSRRANALAQTLSAGGGQAKEPPAPHLQTQPFKDVYPLRQGESEKLTSYGWVDKDGGVDAHSDRSRDGSDAAAGLSDARRRRRRVERGHAGQFVGPDGRRRDEFGDSW